MRGSFGLGFCHFALKASFFSLFLSVCAIASKNFVIIVC